MDTCTITLPSTVRFQRRSRRFRLAAWGERVIGRDRDPGRALAVGGEAQVTRGPLCGVFWLAYSRRSGSGARIYAFRPEA